MNKRVLGRGAGFLVAMGATAGLVGIGVNMTGAYFQDTESARVAATTGEVDVSVDAAGAELSAPFADLMPGGAGATNTYRFRNVGTESVDFYLESLGWTFVSGTANPGTTVEGDVIRLDSTGQPAGTSYEWTDENYVQEGSTLSFQWRSPGGSDPVACGGGVPRLFIRGGAINTWDTTQDCGSAPDADGWRTITFTLPAGTPAGAAGGAGLVNDNTSDPGVIEVRNVTIGGEAPESNFDECAEDVLRVTYGASGPYSACSLPGAVLVAEDVPAGDAADIPVTLSLTGGASNVWASQQGSGTLKVIATQANQAPTTQADQVGNDAS